MVDDIKQYQPARYNRQSELTPDETVEGPNRFTFNLSSEYNASAPLD